MREYLNNAWHGFAKQGIAASAVLVGAMAFAGGALTAERGTETKRLQAEVDAAPTRIARVGIMTDTHVMDAPESFRRLKGALGLFKRLGAEMIVNCGDVAERHSPAAYRRYRATVNAVYPEASARPKEVFVYAYHDVFGLHPEKGWDCAGDAAEAFAAMKPILEIPNEHTCDFVWKGLPFAVFPQSTGRTGFPSWADYEARVARLCRENPGKPVFVLDHAPAAGTTFHSRHWGCEDARRILNRYPQVVQISGHVHGCLKSERQIWQGQFTAVNAGCLDTWAGFAPGSTPPRQSKLSYGVLVMDVYADRLDFFRYDVRDGRECAAPWRIPLPFVAETAPYRPEARAAALPLPAFAPDAAVSVTAEGDGYRVAFPEARAGADPFMYRLAAQRRAPDGTWQTYSRDDVFGDFWKADKERTGRMSYRLDAAFFTAGETHRLLVTPLDFFYRAGRAASCTFTATHAPLPLVWAWNGSPDVFRFSETRGGPAVAPTVGGRYVSAGGLGALEIADPAFATLKPGTRHRMVMDLDLVQPDGDWCAWQMVLAVRNGVGLAHAQSAPGAPGTLRYVFAFTVPPKGLAGFHLMFHNKTPGASFRIVRAELR